MAPRSMPKLPSCGAPAPAATAAHATPIVSAATDKRLGRGKPPRDAKPAIYYSYSLPTAPRIVNMHADNNSEDLMNVVALKIALCAVSTLAFAAAAQAVAGPSGPSATAPFTPIVAPKDRPYSGEIQLKVDATDLSHRVVRVHETLTGIGPDTVLLY